MCRMLAELGRHVDDVQRQPFVIGLSGPMGTAKSYLINTLLMTGCEWAADAGDRCQPNAPCKPERPCFGHAGPMPSQKQKKSLTSLIVRVRFAPALSLRVKRGDEWLPGAEQIPQDISAESMQQVRQHILGHSGPGLIIEIGGPFPGLLELNNCVKDLLPSSDGALFDGVEFVDLPGENDNSNSFPPAAHRPVLGQCALILFRATNPGGRQFPSSTLVRLVELGALPSFVHRATLVYAFNLESDDLERIDGQAPTMQDLRVLLREGMREQFQTLLPESEAQAAASDLTCAEDRTEVSKNRETLVELLGSRDIVQVESGMEGDALWAKARDEADVLIFSSRQHDTLRRTADQAAHTTNTEQLAHLIVREVREKSRIARLFPLLDRLQQLGTLLKRRVNTLMSMAGRVPRPAAADPVTLFGQLVKSKSPAGLQLPTLDFLRLDAAGLDTVDGLKSLLDRLEIGAMNQPSARRYAAFAAELKRPEMLQELRAQLRRLLLHSFDGVLDELDALVDASLRGLEARGFLRVLHAEQCRVFCERMANDLFNKLDTFVDSVVKAPSTLSKDNKKFLTSLAQEKQSADEHEDEGDDATTADNLNQQDAEAETEAPPTPLLERLSLEEDLDDKSRRHALELTVRLLLHRALQWNRVNLPNNRGSSAVRDQLRKFARDLREQCAQNLKDHLAADVAPASAPAVGVDAAAVPSSTGRRAELKCFADEIDGCVRSIRAAMQCFNPSYGPTSPEQVLLSEDTLPTPRFYDPDPQVTRLPFDDFRRPTAEQFEERRTKLGFKYQQIVSLLGLNSARCLQLLENLQLGGPPAQSASAAQVRALRQRRFAAVLVAAAYRKLDITTPTHQEAALSSVTDKDILAVEPLVWSLGKSTVRCIITPAVSDPVITLIGPESPTASLVAHFTGLGNEIIRVERDLVNGRFEARVPPAVLDRMRSAATDLAPIFIPSRRCGDDTSLGNLWLDRMAPPRAADTDAESVLTFQQQLGLENEPAQLFVIIEPRTLWRFMHSFGCGASSADAHPHTRITWILLPVNFAFFGMSLTIGKLVAESLHLPRYWTIDDDLSGLEQFDTPGRWFKASFRRCLLFGQAVYDHVLQDQYVKLDTTRLNAILQGEEDRMFAVPHDPARHRQHFDLFRCLQTVLANAADRYGMDLNRNPHLIIESVLRDDPNYVSVDHLSAKWPLLAPGVVAAAFASVEEQVRVLARGQASSFAGVSIAHQRGKKSGYVHKQRGSNYRRSVQRYQMVLHNTDATRGHNMAPDSTLLGVKPWHGQSAVISASQQADLDDWRRNKLSGCKGPDHPYTRTLQALGIIGVQVYNFTHERLKFAEEEDKAAWMLTSDADSHAMEEEEDNEEDH